MKAIKFLFTVLQIAALSALFSFVTGVDLPVSVSVISVLMAVRVLVPIFGGYALADPLTTIFTRDLQKMLFPDNSFYKNAVKIGTGAGIDAAYFDIPQELELPSVVINPSTFPLEVEELQAGNEQVAMDLIATKPTRLGDREAAEVSYDKRKSILTSHDSVIEDSVAAIVLNKWAPANGNIINTTGASVSSSLPGTTGNRLAITKDNLIKSLEILDRSNIKGNRFGLAGATQYAELLGIPEFIDYNKIGNTNALEKGFIGEILGMKILKRSQALVYATGGTVKAVGAATASTDNEAMLIWSDNAVGIVEGAVKVYINVAQAQYLGDVMNAAVRFGTRKMRTDAKGVVAIRQAAGV